jgi:hypothetical protein
LVQQPSFLSDTNALDLGFFSSIQSLTLLDALNTLKELIQSIERAYDGYDVEKLNRVFVTLQSCLMEILKDQGGMRYKIPHMDKEKLQKESELSMALSVDAQLYQSTLEIIADHESNLDSSLIEEGTKKKRHSRKKP